MTSERRKVRAQTFVYKVGDGLYINLTNKCSNACEFCIRNNADGAYGSDSLWLEREPSADEVIKALEGWDIHAFSEVVFCGYGEPTYRLQIAVEIAKQIKSKYPDAMVRMNTNGQSDLICGEPTAKYFKGVFDTVSISLNTPSRVGYQKLCHSIFGEAAHDALIAFAKEVKQYVPRVLLSVVRQTLTEEELEECERIASSCGVELKVREYIG